MHGTLNGVPLERIIAIRTESTRTGRKRTTLRALSPSDPALDVQLQPGATASLILPNTEIKGRLIRSSVTTSVTTSSSSRSNVSRTRINLEKIHAKLAWVDETPDPNKCGCRNVQCCEETGHSAANAHDR
jgi:hypothetical protein